MGREGERRKGKRGEEGGEGREVEGRGRRQGKGPLANFHFSETEKFPRLPLPSPRFHFGTLKSKGILLLPYSHRWKIIGYLWLITEEGINMYLLHIGGLFPGILQKVASGVSDRSFCKVNGNASFIFLRFSYVIWGRLQDESVILPFSLCFIHSFNSCLLSTLLCSVLCDARFRNLSNTFLP
jgi:hypothetical protein